ncbi:MAG: type II secretion system protein [Magnetococcales bacterium]|nr:type II secretion system protein [Magnetococcales bacterium]MBF0172425.1 type II secretion system protein [Magnetococcales bacterium]MBF0631399.1 type II secretion system protein [Magnetococcales bacterium]
MKKIVRRKGSNEGFTLVELMVVVTIIAILSAVGLPRLNKYVRTSEATEALEVSGWIVKAIHGYVDSQTGTTIEVLNGLFQPGSMGNLNGDSPDKEISTLIPHLTAPRDVKFQYEINAVVQESRDVWICIRAWEKKAGADPNAFILYSGAQSNNPQWQGHSFLAKFVDVAIPATAGGNCDASGGAVADQD